MVLKDEVNDIKKEVKIVKELNKQSIAREVLADYKKQNHRLFIIIIIILALWFATGMYLIYILNDIGTETTQVDMDAEGSNNYIGGDNNGSYQSN